MKSLRSGIWRKGVVLPLLLLLLTPFVSPVGASSLSYDWAVYAETNPGFNSYSASVVYDNFTNVDNSQYIPSILLNVPIFIGSQSYAGDDYYLIMQVGVAMAGSLIQPFVDIVVINGSQVLWNPTNYPIGPTLSYSQGSGVTINIALNYGTYNSVPAWIFYFGDGSPATTEEFIYFVQGNTVYGVLPSGTVVYSKTFTGPLNPAPSTASSVGGISPDVALEVHESSLGAFLSANPYFNVWSSMLIQGSVTYNLTYEYSLSTQFSFGGSSTPSNVYASGLTLVSSATGELVDAEAGFGTNQGLVYYLEGANALSYNTVQGNAGTQLSNLNYAYV